MKPQTYPPGFNRTCVYTFQEYKEFWKNSDNLLKDMTDVPKKPTTWAVTTASTSPVTTSPINTNIVLSPTSKLVNVSGSNSTTPVATIRPFSNGIEIGNVAKSLELTSKSITDEKRDEIQKMIDTAAFKLSNEQFSDINNMSCLFENCDVKPKDYLSLNLHLLWHKNPSIVRNTECFFCTKEFKSDLGAGIPNHIKTHVSNRFFCFFCQCKSSAFTLLYKHVSSAHNFKGLKMLPINPNLTDRAKDIFVIGSDTITDEDVFNFGLKLINENETLQNKYKKVFSPEEVEQLPKNSIFQHEISCSKCNYATKVRKNMLRHLSFHQNEFPVAKLDPVNPVPCLDTGEKHFDKMTNYACSSNLDKDKQKAFLDAPCFVPDTKRFVCGAKDCHYLTLSEEMLRCHLTTLHVLDKEFSCGHCKNKTETSVDEMLKHMRLHDLKLYRCSNCDDYYQNTYAAIEKHIYSEHPTIAATVITIRDGLQQSTSEKSKETIWQCNNCQFTAATRTLIVQHNADKHSIHSQFNCELCGARSSSRQFLEEHHSKSHPVQDLRIFQHYSKMGDSTNSQTAPLIRDNAPLWKRDSNKIKHIRGILFEEEEDVPKKKTKKRRESTIDGSTIGESSDDTSDRLYGCNYCNFTSMFAEIKKHHNEKHERQNFIPKPIGLQISKEIEGKTPEKRKQKKRTHNIQYLCGSCKLRTTDLTVMRNHWKEKHQMPKTPGPSVRQHARPFAYRITKNVKCYYCKEIRTFNEMIPHFHKIHEDKPFITLDSSTGLTCGECPFKYVDLAELKEHYESCHQTDVNRVKQLPEDLMQKSVIEKFILNPSESMFICRICNAESESVEELENHHSEMHHAQETDIVAKENKNVYGCCREWPLNESELVEHIKSKHLPSANNQQKLRQLTDSIRILFPNGFSCYKGETIYTTHGNLQSIFDKLLAQPQKISASVRRRRSSTNIDLESIRDSIDVMETAPKRHKKSPTPEPNQPPLSTSSSSTSNIKPYLFNRPMPKCKKILRPGPYSHYGHPIEKDDLSQIFTTIKVGESSARISCDQVWNILRINPLKVHVEKLNVGYVKKKYSI